MITITDVPEYLHILKLVQLAAREQISPERFGSECFTIYEGTRYKRVCATENNNESLKLKPELERVHDLVMSFMEEPDYEPKSSEDVKKMVENINETLNLEKLVGRINIPL